MSGSSELYNQLGETLKTLVKVNNHKRVTNWAWLVVGILQSGSCHLSQIANYLPMDVKAESRVTLIRRWLDNKQVYPWKYYKSILEHIFQNWKLKQAVIILDGVMVFGDRMQVFRVSLRYGNRAIPLAWKVVKGKGLVKVTRLKAILGKVHRLMKRYVSEVMFLADAGFRDCDWAQLCAEFGWNYAIRIACNTYITRPDGFCERLDRCVPVNQNHYFQDVLLTREAKLKTNVSVTWTTDKNGKPEMVAIMTNQIACRARLREYAGRMAIEQSFRDDKSGGFDLEHTRLRHPQRLERLLLALAIATLWSHEVGEFALSQSEDIRQRIDPSYRRSLSVFQIGLRWLKRALATTTLRLPTFSAILRNFQFKPVTLAIAQNANV